MRFKINGVRYAVAFRRSIFGELTRDAIVARIQGRGAMITCASANGLGFGDLRTDLGIQHFDFYPAEEHELEAFLACAECGFIFCTCTLCAECDELVVDSECPCGGCPDHCDCWKCVGCRRLQAADDATCDVCDSCNSCCDCWHCDGCDRNQRSEGSQCDACRQCAQCCSRDNACYYCELCNTTVSVSDTCGDCNHCDSCCDCNGDPPPPTVRRRGALKFWSAARSEFAKNRSRRYLAAEIEVNGWQGNNSDLEAIARRWNAEIGEDGSLASGGFEIRTAPAQGDQFLKQVEEFSACLKAGSAEVTNACGLHVHADSRRFTWEDLRKLILVYKEIEPAIFGMLPDYRQSNNYCQKCGDTLALALGGGVNKKRKHAIVESIYPGSCDLRGIRPCHFPANPNCSGCNEKKYPGRGTRYNALNLHSHLYRGTIEFRMHSGTVDARKITQWGMICAEILDWVEGHTEKDVSALKGSSYAKLIAILPAHLHGHVHDRTVKFSGDDAVSLTGS